MKNPIQVALKSVLAAVVLLFPVIASAHEGEEHEAGGPQSFEVASVNSGSPAAAAGIQDGDQIISLDGRELASMDDFQEVMASHQPGDTVPMVVKRNGESVHLTLTFGERDGGGVSIGVSINVTGMPAGDGKGTVECLNWIDKTYSIESMLQELGLDLSDDYATMRQCVERDTSRMMTADAIKYCDNVFKVHCSGVDLLTEIGEAQIEQCEQLVSDSQGLKLGQYKGWRTCAEQKVFERYSVDGESSDEDACLGAFLEECGTNIDAVVNNGGFSTDQKGFVNCCSADALDPSGQDCPMIDDGFQRGPCKDRSVCVNRLTSEWLHCSVLE